MMQGEEKQSEQSQPAAADQGFDGFSDAPQSAQPA
ncbi:MAG: hypothetical protein JWQ23_3, partial [Herminiimonas sp.]|nr:hypothetical protein [Herminiimonas sp.]